MKSVPLSEVAEINPKITNSLPSEIECSFVPMDCIDEKQGKITQIQIRNVQEVLRGYTPFQENDVLVAKITPCMENGKAAIAKNLINGIGFGTTEFHVIRARENIIPEWIFYFIHRPDFRNQAERRMTGSAGQKRVPESFLKEAEIPLPPLDEQKRIATILDQADRIRRLRHQATQLTNTFLQSVFIEMFGDPVENPLNLEFIQLGNVSEIASGVTKGQKFNGKKTRTVPYLRVANVQDGYFDLSEIKEVEALETEIGKLQLINGDILMTEGGDYDKLGRGAIWREQIPGCIHQNHIFRVRLDDSQTLPEVFEVLLQLKYSKEHFIKCSKQTTNLATINMTQLKEYPVPIISLSEQKKFKKIYEEFSTLHSQKTEAERQAEQLFQSLLHQAFTGQLSEELQTQEYV